MRMVSATYVFNLARDISFNFIRWFDGGGRLIRSVLSGECVLPHGVSVRLVLPGIGRGPQPLPDRCTVI